MAGAAPGAREIRRRAGDERDVDLRGHVQSRYPRRRHPRALRGLDVTRAGPLHSPRPSPSRSREDGCAATVALKNDPAAGLTINADGAVAGLGVTHRGEPKLTVSDQRLAFAVDEVRLQGQRVSRSAEQPSRALPASSTRA